MEESLFTQRQIRQYFKCYSEAHHNRVARATMMLGIQELMRQNNRALQGDFSYLSPDDLEEQVIENELKLYQKVRQLKLKRSRSRESSAEKANTVAAPEHRRVTIMEQPSVSGDAAQDEDLNSTVPQPSIPSQVLADEIQMEKGPAAAKTSNSNNSTMKTQTDTPEQSKDKITEVNVSNIKPRFQRDYSRQKSSSVMKTLLEADANLIKKQSKVVSGSQITSKIAFDKKRNQEPNSAREPQGILGGTRGKKPSIVRQEANSLDRANSNDGVRSRSRASSKWRRGVTQDSLEKQAQESARVLEEKKQIGMVYPSWWQLDEEESPKRVTTIGQGIADPVRAKVHKKTLGRYAEDSLDARLRQVRDFEETGSIEVDQLNENMNQVNLQNNRVGMVEGYQQNPNILVRGQQSESQVSSTQQIDPHQQLLTPNQMSSTSSKKVNMLDTTKNNQSVGNLNKMNGTQASMSSFAYTSNKAVPKYSPARAPRDGASNIPMSYSGPPTKQEMNRNYMRHMSGNRNFNGRDQEEAQQVSEPRLMNVREPPQNSFKRAAKAKKEKKSVKKQQMTLIEQGHKNYISMQKEAQRNRARNQEEIEGDDQFRNRDKAQYADDQNYDSQVQDESLSMQKFAKGGISMTIACVPAEERNRSGSQPRNPYGGAEPFYQPQQERRQTVQNSRNFVQRPETAKRVPKQYSGVQSTIKERVQQDKRLHQSRQNEGSPQVQIYEPNTNNDSQVEQNDSSYNQGVQAQIFYKKDDSKVLYAEGQDSYRPPPQYQYSQQEVARYNNSKAEASSNSTAQVPSLRRRAVSPQTQAAISSQQRSRQQAPPQAYYNVRSSYDTHNETGFTNKLMAQNYSNQPQSLYVPQSNQISSGQASIQQQSSYADQRNEFYPVGPGQQMYQNYFDQNGRQVQATGPNSQYVEYNYKNMPGQILVPQNQKYPEQQQQYYEQESSSAADNGEGFNDTYGEPRTDDLQYTDERRNMSSAEEDKNNTSRFAFSNEQNRGNQNESNIDNGQNFYQNQSNFDQNNFSHGGSKAQLQNQLEQVLMMKSGEFSAGGRGQDNGHLRSAGSLGPIENEEVGFGPDRGRQAYQPSGGNYLVSEYGRRSQERMQQQNYGNPNFVPPSNYREEGGAFRNYQSDLQSSGYRQDYRHEQPIYKNQYPATYQQYEQQSSQKNFNTSQFAGNQDPSQQKTESMHQKQNSRTQFAGMPFGNNSDRNQNGNNFTLSRPSAQNYAPEPQFQGSYQQMRHEANMRRDPNGYNPVYQPMPPQVHGEMQPPSVGPGSYRISSGRNRPSIEEEKQPAKYYQTFNEDESSSFIQQQTQQQQQPEDREQNTESRKAGMDSEELSEYSGNKILGKNNQVNGRPEDDEVHEGGMESSAQGEDDGAQDTSQLSPTQTTPGQYTAERRAGVSHTDNLRNFMEEAQPGLGVLESQNITPSQQAPSGSVNGVRKIQNYSQNNYAGLANKAVDYTNEESSPEISDTNNLSPSPANKIGQVQAIGEDDFSSLQETPDSPLKQGTEENLINKNLEKISSHAMQLSNHLQQMNDQYAAQNSGAGGVADSSLNDTKNLNEASSPEVDGVYNDTQQESRGKQMASESLSDLNDSQL